MLSKKADLKNSELIGVLGASIICAKQGCEADGPEIRIGPHTIRLYQGPPKAEAPRRERGKQLSLFDLTKSATRGAVEAQRRPGVGERPRKPEAKREEAPPNKEEQPAAAAKLERREALRVEDVSAVQAPQQESGDRLDRARLVESVAGATGLSPVDAERVLNAIMTYLSSYPSVGVLRLLDDIRRSAKVDPDIVKRVLNVLRAYDVVELHELGVVNLKKRVEFKTETRL